jgi:galactokinase
LVEAARCSPGTFGARMTGGGFGGCTVNLVREDAVADFERQIAGTYRAAFGAEVRIYRGDIADGLITLEEEPHG